jgi:hypothetical protein
VRAFLGFDYGGDRTRWRDGIRSFVVLPGRRLWVVALARLTALRRDGACFGRGHSQVCHAGVLGARLWRPSSIC